MKEEEGDDLYEWVMRAFSTALALLGFAALAFVLGLVAGVSWKLWLK